MNHAVDCEWRLLSGTSCSSLKSYGLMGSPSWEPVRTLQDSVCYYSLKISHGLLNLCLYQKNPYLFLPALCERRVTDTSSSSSSESDSLSFLERFFSFSRTCRARSHSITLPYLRCLEAKVQHSMFCARPFWSRRTGRAPRPPRSLPAAQFC